MHPYHFTNMQRCWFLSKWHPRNIITIDGGFICFSTLTNLGFICQISPRICCSLTQIFTSNPIIKIWSFNTCKSQFSNFQICVTFFWKPSNSLGPNAQQSRGWKKLFFEFYQILPKYENRYHIKAGFEVSFKCDAYKHKKKHFKVAENTACLPEAVIYEV